MYVIFFCKLVSLCKINLLKKNIIKVLWGWSGEGVFAMAYTDQNITMISSKCNIITQYMFCETMSSNN